MIPFIACAICTLFGYLLCYCYQVRPLQKTVQEEHTRYRQAKVRCLSLAFKVRRLQEELYLETQPTDTE